MRRGGNAMLAGMFGRNPHPVRRSDRPLVHLVLPRWGGSGMNKAFAHRFPPMSLLVLAALCEREGWEARMIDECYEPLPDERPDLAAITVWTGFAPRAYQIADRYRSRGIPVLLGGVHASLMPAEGLLHADAVVAGEAELVLGKVLGDVLGGTLQPYYHGQWAGMEHVPMVDELESSYMRLPYGRYQPTHTVQTTRGCRFNCDYCSVIRINGRGTRHADVDRVIDDIRRRTHMKPRMPGAVFIFFLDDDLASDLEYAGDLFEALASANMNVRWTAQASIGLCRSPDLIDLAARSGCRSLFCGLESVSRSSLVEANKKNRPDEYAELIARAHSSGVAIEGAFIFGFDHDHPGVFDETVDVLDEIGVDLAHFFLLTPFPGTHTFARYYEGGRIIDFDWGHYDSYTPVVEPANMSAAELQEGLYRAYRKFYAPAMRRRRFLRELRRREPMWSATYAMINRSYARLSRNLDTPAARLQPPFRADPAHLDAVLAASQVEASRAIEVAGGDLLAGRVTLSSGGTRPKA